MCVKCRIIDFFFELIRARIRVTLAACRPIVDTKTFSFKCLQRDILYSSDITIFIKKL